MEILLYKIDLKVQAHTKNPNGRGGGAKYYLKHIESFSQAL